MGELPFNFELNWRRGNSFPHNRNRYTSSQEINSEWSLNCLWKSKNNYYIPDLLEICRKKTLADIVVSGTLKLVRDQSCLLQRRFIQLIEAGSTKTQVVLEFSSNNGGYYDDDYYTMYTISGTLTIPAKVSLNKSVKVANYESILELSNNFKCLLDPKGIFSDVKLKCGTVSFSVHKSILSVRSPVFAAMFTTEMKEKGGNMVDIIDISPDVLKILLMYIYTGNTGELSVESASKLLFAGDKYQIQDLKRVCCDHLKSCVSVQNVVNSLTLGYLHDKGLKVFAMDYICDGCDEFEVLEKTVEWKNLLEKIPSLAMEVLTCLVKSKDKKLKNHK